MFDTKSTLLYIDAMSNILYFEAAMSYRKKGAWAYLIAVAGSKAIYVKIIVGRVTNAPVGQAQFAATLLWTTLGSTVESVVVGTMIETGRPSEGRQRDVRDREIDRFGESASRVCVVLGAAATMLDGDGLVGPLLEREPDLRRVRAVSDPRVRGEDRRIPAWSVAMVKPTRIDNSIRALRFARGEMTQAQLAERIELTHQNVVVIEQGRYSPSLELAHPIGHVFKVPQDQASQYPEPDEVAS
jgi:putative transcriptional regulator